MGLGYLTLGQSTATFSGGEVQRLKMAKALAEKRTGQTLYILDEPTSGLHFSDIQHLLDLLVKITGEGHTVVIVEHNRDMIRNADWIIDLGPEGGARGGWLMVQGTPQEVCKAQESETGRMLAVL